MQRREIIRMKEESPLALVWLLVVVLLIALLIEHAIDALSRNGN